MPPSLPSKRIRLPYPSSEIAEQTIVRLQSLLVYGFDADERLAEVEAEAEKYRRERALLQQKIFRCRAIIANVRRLPLEIITSIFEFLVAISPDTIVQVQNVCRSWREAARPSHLWSILHLKEGVPGQGQRKAALFLQRSGSFPLNITYVQAIPNAVALYNIELPWKAWNTVGSDAQRWRSLDLDFHDSLVSFYRLSTLNDAPNLKRLTLRIRRQCSVTGLDGHFGLDSDKFPSVVPLLSSLTLHTFVLPPVPGRIFHQLTTLHIYDTFSKLENPRNNLTPINAKNILTVLSSCVNLEEFSLNGGETYHWYVLALNSRTTPDPNTPMIHLPALRRLTLDCHVFVGKCIMNYLSTFYLEHASLMFHPRHELYVDNPTATAATEFLKRAPNLRSLYVLGLPLTECIGGLRNLEKLELDSVPVLNDIFGRLSDVPKRQRAWYAPKLRSIKIDTEFDMPDDDSLPVEQIARCVKARYLANQRHGSPRIITELTINKRDMLKDAPPGEMVPYPRKQRFVGYDKQPWTW